MAEQFDSRYFRGQGPLFIAPRDAAGKPAGLIFIGDVGTATLTPSVERVDLRENVSGKNLLASSFSRGVQIEFSMTMRSIKRAHFARALQGDGSDKVAASVTDEPHSAYLGKFIALKHNKVSAVVVTHSSGTPTYVANTDYKVHADEGLVEILDDGDITEAQALLIHYSYAAQYHLQVNPANEDVYLVFAGKNSADNDKQTRCEVYKANLDPSALSLITDEHAEMTLSGRVLYDPLRPVGDQFYSWKVEE